MDDSRHDGQGHGSGHGPGARGPPRHRPHGAHHQGRQPQIRLGVHASADRTVPRPPCHHRPRRRRRHDRGLALAETAPGVTVEQIHAATEARCTFPGTHPRSDSDSDSAGPAFPDSHRIGGTPARLPPCLHPGRTRHLPRRRRQRAPPLECAIPDRGFTCSGVRRGERTCRRRPGAHRRCAPPVRGGRRPPRRHGPHGV